MKFILQSDLEICTLERAAVRHAVMKVPADAVPLVRQGNLAEVCRILPGEAAAEREACPVGTVEFCRAWMCAVGVDEPEPIDYPPSLDFALHRSVRQTTFAQAAAGSWVKPVSTKAWEPHVKQSEADHLGDEPVWEAPVIPDQDWLAQWRVYVVEGVIVGAGRYDDNEQEYDLPRIVVASWVDAYTASGQSPAGYALDVALWPGNRLALVEVTDGWAIGYYKGDCSATNYARLLAARWSQIIAPEAPAFKQQKDQYAN